MPRFQVPPPLRGFRGSEVSEVIWTLKLLGTVTELRISLKKVSYGTLTLRGQSSAPLWVTIIKHDFPRSGTRFQWICRQVGVINSGRCNSPAQREKMGVFGTPKAIFHDENHARRPGAPTPSTKHLCCGLKRNQDTMQDGRRP
eukprot:scaffold32343_cov38-Phaeocystis_antarctica.AAC.1